MNQSHILFVSTRTLTWFLRLGLTNCFFPSRYPAVTPHWCYSYAGYACCICLVSVCETYLNRLSWLWSLFFNDVWWMLTNTLVGMWKEAVVRQSDALSRQVLGRTEDVIEEWGLQMSGAIFEPRSLTFQEGRKLITGPRRWIYTLIIQILFFSWRVCFVLKLTQLQWMCECIQCSQTITHIPRDPIETVKHFNRTAMLFISSALKQCHSLAVCWWTLHGRLVALQRIKQNRTALEACRLPRPTGRIVTGLRGGGGWVTGFRSERDSRRTFLWIFVPLRRRAVYHLWLWINAFRK